MKFQHPTLVVTAAAISLLSASWLLAGTVKESWVQRYNGPAGHDDRATAVAVDAAGNVVVTGYSAVNKTNADFYTAKYAARDGALFWERRYSGTVGKWNWANAIAVDDEGNVIVTGASAGNTSINDYYTAKYAALGGTLLWEQRYNGPANGNDYANAVAVDAMGNVVVTGDSGGDHCTTKYAAAHGDLLWEQRNYGANGSARALAIDANGDVVMVGDSWNGDNADYYTAKYAATDGALLWEVRYNGPSNRTDYAHAVAACANGDVVVTGVSGSTGGDYYTAKYAAADGMLLWEMRDDPAGQSDEATALALDVEGNVIVTGTSQVSAGNSDIYTAKYAAADGALLWFQRYDGPPSGQDYGHAVAVDAAGNVVVMGHSDNSDGLADYYTAKYAAADGALLWEIRYPAAASSSTRPCLALGPGGEVVVTGTSGGGTNADYVTVKYVELPTLTSLQDQSGYQLEFPALPGKQYPVQGASMITGPWTTLTNVTASANGYIIYRDVNAPFHARFYRLGPPW